MLGKVLEVASDFVYHLTIILFCLFVCFCFWKCINREDVPNQRDGAEQVREEYLQVTNNQRELTEGLQQSADQASSIRDGISEVRREAQGTEAKLREADQLLAECESIIERVRRRAEEETPKH